jgi:hypothetical protein
MGYIGAGSSYHWSDRLRSIEGNFNIMSESRFVSMYSQKEYNKQLFNNAVKTFTGKAAQSLFEDHTDDRMNVYIISAFGHNTLVSCFGEIGPVEEGLDGALYSNNPTAHAYCPELNITGRGEFNWGIPIGAAGTAIYAGTAYADNLVRTSFKTGRNPVSWSKLTPKQQAWRIANVLGKNANYVKYAKVAGVVGTGISVGMAGRDIYMGDGTTIDYFDVGVGTASIGAALFLASNPVGWVIGAGAAIYFGGRLVYDIYEEVND